MNALVSAWELDGQGGGKKHGGLAACRTVALKSPLWMHVVRTETDAQQFLECMPDTPPFVRKALFAEDTRPRCEVINDGLLLNLRAVNTNPDAEPTDLLAVRIWATETRAISMRRFKVNAVEQIRKGVEKGHGPKSIMQFILTLAEKLADQLTDILEALEDRFEALEESEDNLDIDRVAALRKEVVAYRRFIEPQLAALSKLVNAQLSWMTEADRNSLRHVVDMVARQREHLEALRERAAILKDIHESRRADQMNRTIYFLTIIAGLFLPLSFVTGLLGINVGGIPGAEMAHAFWWVVLGMIIAAVLEVIIFKSKKLI